jgi:hypothetical protein
MADLAGIVRAENARARNSPTSERTAWSISTRGSRRANAAGVSLFSVASGTGHARGSVEFLKIYNA